MHKCNFQVVNEVNTMIFNFQLKDIFSLFEILILNGVNQAVTLINTRPRPILDSNFHNQFKDISYIP